MRLAAWIFILVAFTVLGLPSAWAQGETVEFRIKVERGAVLNYPGTVTSEVNLAGPGGNVRQESRAEYRSVHRFLEVASDGTFQVEVALEDFKATIEGRTEESLQAPSLIRVGRDGRVILPHSGMPVDYPFALPGRRVAVGESWTRQSRAYSDEAVLVEELLTLTLAGLEHTPAGQVAKVRLVGSGRVVEAPDIHLPAGIRRQFRGGTQTTGEIEWSVEQGMILRSTLTIAVEVEYSITTQDRTAQMRLVSRITTQEQLLPNGSVSMPATAPEFLITGGKSIGPVALDLTAADVTAKLGQPARTLSPERTIPGRLIWDTPPLVLYVDPSDTNKIIGVAIGDRKYRTDKGIGFGSSMGALLLAYGPAPATAQVNIPNLGGMRYLTYNDLGISFGITSDVDHARAGPGHAPVGVVDVVIIFPPGQGARVVPLQ